MKTRICLSGFVLILSLFLTSPGVFGQAGRGKARLNGTVLDEAGKPVASATVVLELLQSEGVKRETTTDKDGDWIFMGLGSGNWGLTVTAPGYVPTATTVFVSQIDRNSKVVLKLKKPAPTEGAVIRDEASLGFIEKAEVLYKEKDYDQALSVLEQFLAQNPGAYQANILIGDCYREKGEYDKAIETYTKAIEESKEDEKTGKEIAAKGLAAIGDCYVRMGDFDKAQGYFKQSIDAVPENETLAYNVGEIYFSNQKLDEAIQYFTIATQIKPDWPPPYYKLGLVYLNKADYEKAKENLRKFLELEPDSQQAGEVRNILDYLEKIKK
jgi:tetratricopeptide (TPR) repeat protein